MTDDRPSSRSPRPTRRPTQESPLVWGLLVAVLLLAFVNFLFVAIAAPSAYRIGLAVAAGAFLVLSVVLLIRSLRERRRTGGAAPGATDAGSDAGSDAHPTTDGIAGQGVQRDADDRLSSPDTGRGRPGNGPAV
ncbi:DUF948 domain-containing protein [Microbacteriaceae bacterium 4G12]